MGRGFFTEQKALHKSMFGSLGIRLLPFPPCKMSLAIGRAGGLVAIPGLKMPKVGQSNPISTPQVYHPKCPDSAAVGSARGRNLLIQCCCQTLVLWSCCPKNTTFNDKTCLGSCSKGETSCLHMHSPE